MLKSAFETSGNRVRKQPATAQPWRSWQGASVLAALALAGALAFDALTPQTISVTIFYVGLVLVGFCFPQPKASLALALLATLLIIVGHWITIPDNTPVWEAWLNRALATGTVWLTAVFVWRIRVLEQKLRLQTDLANSLSCEMEHRVGNQLQLVASFLRLQAKISRSEESRRTLELAGSRVMVIGKIQRTLSHSAHARAIDSSTFINELIHDARAAFPDPGKVDITVRVASVELTSTRAMALGALLLELINNALKHAFPGNMKGMLTVSFTASDDNYVLEFADDGAGIDRGQTSNGSGTQNVTDLARLMGGSITFGPACQSATRPGTRWRLVIPA